MSRIAPVLDATATPEETEALAAIRSAWGAVPELGRVIARSNPLTRALLAFDRELGRGRFTGAFAEQIDIAVANENRCPYCLAAHTAAGRALGLDDQALADARTGHAADTQRRGGTDICAGGRPRTRSPRERRTLCGARGRLDRRRHR